MNTKNFSIRTAPIVLILAALFLTGCVSVSEQPLYTSRDLVFDSRLLGTWQEADGHDVVWIGAGTDSGTGAAKTYVLTDEHGARLRAHLLRLNGALFLDLEEDNGHHFLARVWITNNELHISALRRCWLEKQITRGEIAGRVAEGFLEPSLLTASTAQLQTFLASHLNDPRVFDKPGVWRRKGD